MRKNKIQLRSSVESPKYVYKNLKIKIIGIGGGGDSIVKEIKGCLPNSNFVNFIAANTDSQALNSVDHGIKRFLFGENFTHGLGCGMDDMLGEKAAESEKDRISKEIDNANLVILVSSLGGGTGSGASPVFARIAHHKNKLVLGIFTLPFRFEREQRSRIAQASLQKLISFSNAVFIVPNDNIFKIVDSNLPLRKSFSFINSNLARILGQFLDMIYKPGLINVDFADFKTILEGTGRLIYLNSVKASGPNRAQDIIRKVLYNPLSKYNIFLQEKKANSNQKVDRILFNIEGGPDLKMSEVNEISSGITNLYPKTKIIFGVSRKGKKSDKGISVTLFAVFQLAENKKKKDSRKDAKGKIRKKSASKMTKKKIFHHKKGEQKGLPITVSKKPIRRTAIEVKKEEKKAEKELLEEEERLDIPAFLRQKESKDDN